MKNDTEKQKEPDLNFWTRLLGWFTVCYAMSYVGFLETSQGLWFWYVSLRRPDWSPPNWSIQPVWAIVYAGVAWASWEALTAPKSRDRTIGLGFFGAAIALNLIWPYLYFARHLAIGSIVLLVLTVAFSMATAVVFWRIKPRAGWFVVPLVVWIAFLTLLYTVVWRLNRAPDYPAAGTSAGQVHRPPTPR